MFPQLPPKRVSVLVIRVIVLSLAAVVRVMRAAMLVQLPGAIRPLEFMALTGKSGQRDNNNQQGKEFHRRAS